MIYANNAGTTWPKPDVVLEAISATLTAAPVEADAILESAQHRVAAFLNLPSPERLLFAPSCTSALAFALSELSWEAGDKLLTSSLEHHALLRPVEKLARERGVGHVAVPRTADAPIDLDFARDALEEGRVRLVAITAASNVTGERLPIEELAALAHEHGALQLVDAAQTVGIVPFDVAAAGADLVCFAGHKAPLGPQGVGALWAADGVSFDSIPASCAVGEPAAAPTFPGYCDIGAANLAGVAGLAAGLDWLRSEADPGELGAHPRRLAARLLEALSRRPGCTVYGGDVWGRTAAVSLRIDALLIDRAEAFFRARGVQLRAGQHCASQALESIGAVEGTVRISFGVFNSESDVERILEVVDEAIEAASPSARGPGGR